MLRPSLVGLLGFVSVLALAVGCSSQSNNTNNATPAPPTEPPGEQDGGDTDGSATDGGIPYSCSGAADCEQKTSDKYDGLLAKPTDLAAFLKNVPKGGDLHNHLTGAVYAETYLAWAKDDGDCINSTSYSAVYSSSCSATNQATPTSGAFYDSIVKAWSMKDFAPGAQNGHDHFFATFGKYGAVAGAHRDEDIADVLTRAASENQVYVETMFNLGKNLGTLSASSFAGTVTTTNIADVYDALINAPTFATQLDADVAVVEQAGANYRNVLGCNGTSPPAACNVGVRFIAQVARTGANDNIFGQLVSAYEMAAKTKFIVGANLSSPEDDATSLNNYDVHMAMLDFLNAKYTAAGTSPLHITLHAGELVAKFVPAGHPDALTGHVKKAVQVGHAERIGHGVDIMGEDGASDLLDEMAAKNVAVEVCLSSNAQILEVAGTAHPLAQYLAHKVPVALATDDQGVSRSSMAGEYFRAATDQKLSYRQLKTIARNSLEHAFLPGASLFSSVADATPVADCAGALGETPSASCKAYLDTNERAATQWELERRFVVFEKNPQ